MKRRTNENEKFWDLVKILKKFYRKNFLVNLGHILKKCKRKKNLESLIGKIFLNF